MAEDISKGGSTLFSVHARGNCIKGRCFAAQGETAEAEAALELAAQIGADATTGLFLHEVLAVRDLKLHVLDKAGRGTEGSMRLKAAIHRLLGAHPVADQIAELAQALGPGINLSEVLD